MNLVRSEASLYAAKHPYSFVVFFKRGSPEQGAGRADKDPSHYLKF